MICVKKIRQIMSQKNHIYTLPVNVWPDIIKCLNDSCEKTYTSL